MIHTFHYLCFVMDISQRIARRISKTSEKNKLSRPIVGIAITGVALGVTLMILSISIVKGFQEEVRNKVVGFGSHIQILNNNNNYSKETTRLDLEQDFYSRVDSIPGIKGIQAFATKPGILETKENLQGVIIKGVWDDYNWDFFETCLVEGKRIEIENDEKSESVLISKAIANRLNLELNDKVTLYFVLQEGDIKPRNFTVSGIYDTGLKEFDQQFVFVDMHHLQKVNAWGIEAQIRVLDQDCAYGVLLVEGLGFGGLNRLEYKWNNNWRGPGPHKLVIQGDTTITLKVSDRSTTYPDSAQVHISFLDNSNTAPSVCNYEISRSGGNGSYNKYAGGFEVLVEDYKELDYLHMAVADEVPYYLQTVSITDRNPEIFSWLEMLDLNVSLIIWMMILIAVVNMTSALLIIILERTNMIGLLKAFGMDNKAVMKIFIRHAGVIIVKGMVLGNVIGFGLAILQQKTSFVGLDPASYYVSSVPIKFDLPSIFLVQLVTFCICIFMMLLPAWYVSRISPVKAIRFD